ncbi:MAG TPA: phosphoserine phosphatase SerB [Clostridia bacterium]|nr:phosphoserine phosphatase SerB [Clostridia bacterium]
MNRFVITLLGRALFAEHLRAANAIALRAGLEVDCMERISDSIFAPAKGTHAGCACVRLRVRGEAEIGGMRASFNALADELDIDICIEDESTFGRKRRLIVLDMDSTLIQAEVIDELAKIAGAGEQVSNITASAMRGEIDFKQSFTNRLSFLRGVPEQRARELRDAISLTDGAERLISTVKKLGYKTAIVSGGFTFIGEHLQELLGIDYMFANELEISDGFVTGRVRGEIVDGRRKAELLQEIAAKEGISPEEVVAVGDGANDLPMLTVAGMGIAFHAKPIVRQSAPFAISSVGLDGILGLLDVSDCNVPD